MAEYRGGKIDSALKAWVRALEKTEPIAANPGRTLPVLIDDLADAFGEAAALLTDTECVSYRDLAQKCRRYARWALRQGLARGDVVCLMMANCPDYMAIWLGLTRVGVTVALVNTNLVGEQLAHCIRIAAPGVIIVGEEYTEILAATLSVIDPPPRCWVHGGAASGFSRIDPAIQPLPCEPLQPAECPPPSIADRALYIYTSGTTGLPKAAHVSHFRLMQWSHWFAGMMDTRPTDRMYNCLPMYHSIGGIVATGAVLVNGGSVLIRPHFSAGHFWDDVAGGNCTLFQYIGELCRYLVNSPPHPRETDHRLRLCCGNGLRPDIWQSFQQRFHIPQILEFYAATEASFSLYNCEGMPGAIGRIPGFLAHRFPVALVELDRDTSEPLRNADGFCVRCPVGESGEAIGEISTGSGRFEGYTDDDASEKKVLRNVFTVGDAWFRTGDLMRKDQRGFFYFVDRIGDTFRWKGENVSTTELAAAIAAAPGVAEAESYGVPVPGAEGRAGMAAITVAEDFDLAVFRRHLVERLPDYARPLFLRICGAIETTATFKPKKQQLAREAYDPELTADPIYFDDRARGAFVILDAALFDRIQHGELRL